MRISILHCCTASISMTLQVPRARVIFYFEQYLLIPADFGQLDQGATDVVVSSYDHPSEVQIRWSY